MGSCCCSLFSVSLLFIQNVFIIEVDHSALGFATFLHSVTAQALLRGLCIDSQILIILAVVLVVRFVRCLPLTREENEEEIGFLVHLVR